VRDLGAVGSTCLSGAALVDSGEGCQAGSRCLRRHRRTGIRRGRCKRLARRQREGCGICRMGSQRLLYRLRNLRFLRRRIVSAVAVVSMVAVSVGVRCKSMSGVARGWWAEPACALGNGVGRWQGCQRVGGRNRRLGGFGRRCLRGGTCVGWIAAMVSLGGVAVGSTVSISAPRESDQPQP
jgi:hypothetical protein